MHLASIAGSVCNPGVTPSRSYPTALLIRMIMLEEGGGEEEDRAGHLLPGPGDVQRLQQRVQLLHEGHEEEHGDEDEDEAPHLLLPGGLHKDGEEDAGLQELLDYKTFKTNIINKSR